MRSKSNSKSIEARVEQLESTMTPAEATLIVRLENGEEIEVPAHVYLDDGGKKMKFVKMAHCTLANLDTVYQIIDVGIKEAWEYE